MGKRLIGTLASGSPYESDSQVTEKQLAAFQEMLETQSPPRCMTDDVFIAGGRTLEQHVKDPLIREEIIKNARRHGYNPKPTDIYEPGMVRYDVGPGDPQAFFSHGEGRGKLKRVLESRGVGSGGDATGCAVSTKAFAPVEDPHKRVHQLNPLIVDRIYKQKVKDDPGLKEKPVREVKEAIIDKHAMKD